MNNTKMNMNIGLVIHQGKSDGARPNSYSSRVFDVSIEAKRMDAHHEDRVAVSLAEVWANAILLIGDK